MRATQTHYDNGKDYDVIDVINDFNLNFSRKNIFLHHLILIGKLGYFTIRQTVN